jgi:hypothetical protein
MACRKEERQSTGKQLEKATAEGNTALAGLYMAQWRTLLAHQALLLRGAP